MKEDFMIKEGVLVKYKGTASSAEIPADVTEIGRHAFHKCSFITSIFVPVSVSKIEQPAFGFCISLSEIRYGGTVEQWNSIKKAERWNWHLLATCVNCADGNAEIPQFKIKESIMYEYRGASPSVEIPNCFTAIGESAYESCGSFLTSVKISDCVMSIGDYAFQGCSLLAEIRYDGTVEQWNAVAKGKGWSNYVPAKHVICTDGIVDIPQKIEDDDRGGLYFT